MKYYTDTIGRLYKKASEEHIQTMKSHKEADDALCDYRLELEIIQKRYDYKKKAANLADAISAEQEAYNKKELLATLYTIDAVCQTFLEKHLKSEPKVPFPGMKLSKWLSAHGLKITNTVLHYDLQHLNLLIQEHLSEPEDIEYMDTTFDIYYETEKHPMVLKYRWDNYGKTEIGVYVGKRIIEAPYQFKKEMENALPELYPDNITEPKPSIVDKLPDDIRQNPDQMRQLCEELCTMYKPRK